MPRVTALRERKGGTVAVELDGDPWRTLSAEVVVRAGIVAGLELDRDRLRTLRRELKRSEALAVAVRTLKHGDRSRSELDRRLEHRRVGEAARQEALSALERAGYLDDRRAATSRARALAERGHGDESVRHDLLGRGFDEAAADEAVAALEPERNRARPLVERRGATPATARWLAQRGFGEDAIEAALPGVVAPGE